MITATFRFNLTGNQKKKCLITVTFKYRFIESINHQIIVLLINKGLNYLRLELKRNETHCLIRCNSFYLVLMCLTLYFSTLQKHYFLRETFLWSVFWRLYSKTFQNTQNCGIKYFKPTKFIQELHTTFPASVVSEQVFLVSGNFLNIIDPIIPVKNLCCVIVCTLIKRNEKIANIISSMAGIVLFDFFHVCISTYYRFVIRIKKKKCV